MRILLSEYSSNPIYKNLSLPDEIYGQRMVLLSIVHNASTPNNLNGVGIHGMLGRLHWAFYLDSVTLDFLIFDLDHPNRRFRFDQATVYQTLSTKESIDWLTEQLRRFVFATLSLHERIFYCPEHA